MPSVIYNEGWNAHHNHTIRFWFGLYVNHLKAYKKRNLKLFLEKARIWCHLQCCQKQKKRRDLVEISSRDFKYQLKDRVSLARVENDDVDAGLGQKFQTGSVLFSCRNGCSNVELIKWSKVFVTREILDTFWGSVVPTHSSLAKCDEWPFLNKANGFVSVFFKYYYIFQQN